MHIDTLKNEYKKRYNIMKKLIQKELSDYVYMKEPEGGLYFYLKLKDKDVNTKELFYKLRERKSIYYSGGSFL